jgi:hypothetical protein
MKIRHALAPLAVTLALAGCAGTEAPVSTGTRGADPGRVGSGPIGMDLPERETSPYAGFSADEQAYLQNLDNAGVHYSSEEAAVDVARKACELLDTGQMSPMDIGLMAVEDGGYSYEDAGAIVGSAIGAVCPEHMDLIPG